MEQLNLEADASLADALSTACNTVGRKRIAKTLWPEKTIESARRTLDDCLNVDRRDKLSIEQIELILATAREHDCHTPMNYLCSALRYREPEPITPESERDQLKREYIEATRALQGIAQRIERLGGVASQ